MDTIVSILNAVRSPKTALVVALFSATLLFAPFERIGVVRPSFVEDLYGAFLVALVFSLAILFVEVLAFLWGVLRRPFDAMARRRLVDEIFYSLNLNELCVAHYMAASGMRTIKGAYDNPIMISMRNKGALYVIPGLVSYSDFPHQMPTDLFRKVQMESLERFPADFRNSVRFEDEVRNIVRQATDWRSW